MLVINTHDEDYDTSEISIQSKLVELLFCSEEFIKFTSSIWLKIGGFFLNDFFLEEHIMRNQFASTKALYTISKTTCSMFVGFREFSFQFWPLFCIDIPTLTISVDFTLFHCLRLFSFNNIIRVIQSLQYLYEFRLQRFIWK